jgi:phosphatidate cytidylyltransferase
VVYQKKVDKADVPSGSKFVQRFLTTFTVGPLALYLIYLGGWFYFIPVTALIILASIEYASLLGNLGWRLPLWLLIPSVLLQLVAAQWPALNLFAPALVVSLFATMIYALWLYERRVDTVVPASWIGLAAGILLLGWISGHFFRLRGLGELAVQWTILAIVSTWLADSAAYVFGTLIGKRKLAPRLSPNKTVEGYVAGVILGTLLTLVLGAVMNLPWTIALLLGLLISIFSPAGDLGISLFKREAGVKDSGNLLPGHGGALDRIDSLIWSVTIAYYVLAYLA